MSPWEKAFYQGYAAAVATLCRRDEPSLAYDAMSTNGVTLKHFRDARVDKFDLEPIKQAWRSEHHPASTTRARRGTRP